MLGATFRIIASVCICAAQAPDPALSVSSSDPVLSIRGICPQSKIASRADECTVAVSRERFDELMRIVAPEGQATASMKQSFARTYAETLALSNAARAAGIDHSPQYREAFEWLQLKTLAELLRRRLEKESNNVSEAEIDAHYRERISQFEEVALRRLMLPRANFANQDQQKFEQNAQEIASELRERAAAGEDLDGLQKEAYERLGFNGPSPSTHVGNRRRATLAPEVSQEVFSLKPGEVSTVEKEPYSFVVYQVEAKWILPEKQVRDEISREISRLKLDHALKSITGSIQSELSEKYLGSAH